MGKLQPNGRTNRSLTKISLALNIFFICGSLALAYKIYPYYPQIKEKLFPSGTLNAIQEARLNGKDTSPTVYYDASKFKIIGQLPNTKTYTRLPESAEKNVRPPVWELSKNSAGISVRFSSNSSKIKVRWSLLSNGNPSNMTPVAIKGLDLYAYVDNKWQFVNSAIPKGQKQNEVNIIIGMESKNREYLLNLPLYDGISSLEIGIDKSSSISNPTQKIIDTNNPIIFHGTSITQGASASRPGLTYIALLERYFNKEIINLGFSGNGRFEKEIAEYYMTANPSIIVLDCTPNSGSDIINENLPKTIDYIRSLNDTVPILFVETIMRDFTFFKKDNPSVFGTKSFLNEQNKTLKEIYTTKSNQYKNLYYISNENLIGQDHEATIDGTHFNDLGHYRFYEALRQEIEKIISP